MVQNDEFEPSLEVFADRCEYHASDGTTWTYKEGQLTAAALKRMKIVKEAFSDGIPLLPFRYVMPTRMHMGGTSPEPLTLPEQCVMFGEWNQTNQTKGKTK